MISSIYNNFLNGKKKGLHPLYVSAIYNVNNGGTIGLISVARNLNDFINPLYEDGEFDTTGENGNKIVCSFE